MRIYRIYTSSITLSDPEERIFLIRGRENFRNHIESETYPTQFLDHYHLRQVLQRFLSAIEMPVGASVCFLPAW